MVDETDIGRQMHNLIAKVFPICRSLTGHGVRETLNVISDIIPLTIHEIPTGTKAFDWIIPKEWNISDAFIADEDGNKVIDFKNNNLHVVGYSVPVDKWIPLSELQDHLYSLSDQPNAIPYVTSYYKERWGFCITHDDRKRLKEGNYHVFIDSTLENGSLTYGECIIQGDSKQEVFISTYICHPSMANNELSGPIVTAFIAKWLASKNRRYTYRIIFIPETIGSIAYLSKHMKELKENVVAGFNVSCIGDERAYSYVASRYGDSLADRVAHNILTIKHPDFKKYSFLERGSDERQYCSPGVDLPLVTLSRSKYGTYPEYHTSLDNLDLVTADGLFGGYEFIKDCLYVLENNKIYRVTCFCEPHLGKRGLYPNLSTKKSASSVKTMMDFIAYADGKNDLLEISRIIHKPICELVPIIKTLLDEGLLVEAKV